MTDLAIIGGHVLTMDGSAGDFAPGAVLVEDGAVTAVGPTSIAGTVTAGRRIDATGCIVLPGMVNTHTHAAMTLFRGLGDDEPDRLKRFIWPLEAKAIDSSAVHDGALLGCLEMVLGGVTCFADMYFFSDRVAEAAEAIGLRAVIGQAVMGGPAPDADTAEAAFDRFRSLMQGWGGHPLVTPALAPHAPDTLVTPALAAVHVEHAVTRRRGGAPTPRPPPHGPQRPPRGRDGPGRRRRRRRAPARHPSGRDLGRRRLGTPGSARGRPRARDRPRAPTTQTVPSPPRAPHGDLDGVGERRGGRRLQRLPRHRPGMLLDRDVDQGTQRGARRCSEDVRWREDEGQATARTVRRRRDRGCVGGCPHRRDRRRRPRTPTARRRPRARGG